ncbi:MAG: 16S rRNA (cytosine(1402)-N(4))-methyltransferase RsmH [Bacteroidetes bacterium]|nr:16S rRNA (cytosine(1402)-N(4))-methyltransferase RsmH [Bacteroidota bacterium]
MTPMNEYHVPVMLHECLEALAIKPDGIYVDVTYGGGGHSKEILKRLSDSGRLYAFDQDPDALTSVPDQKNLIFINHNFQYFKNFLKYYDVQKVDGILADLGISSHQIDEAERGFSFRFDADLDMRMSQSGDLSAYSVVNDYPEENLYKIFKEYGELRYARKLAARIANTRISKPITSTTELASLVDEFVPAKQRNRELAQVFQAIRIEVNQEMAVLENMLKQATEMLAPGGRLVVMSYHSLEDRMVKNFMVYGNAEGTTTEDAFGNTSAPLKILTRKPVMADDEEVERNPRSRSAKLRIAEKL